MKYRSSKTNYQHGCRHQCVYGCSLTANKEVVVVMVVVVVVVVQHKFLLMQFADT